MAFRCSLRLLSPIQLAVDTVRAHISETMEGWGGCTTMNSIPKQRGYKSSTRIFHKTNINILLEGPWGGGGQLFAPGHFTLRTKLILSRTAIFRFETNFSHHSSMFCIAVFLRKDQRITLTHRAHRGKYYLLHPPVATPAYMTTIHKAGSRYNSM